LHRKEVGRHTHTKKSFSSIGKRKEALRGNKRPLGGQIVDGNGKAGKEEGSRETRSPLALGTRTVRKDTLGGKVVQAQSGMGRKCNEGAA